jgi:hypothetical protein
LNETTSFFLNESVIKEIDFRYVVKRVLNFKKGNLIYEPLGFNDIKWFIEKDEKLFKKLLFNEYHPERGLAYDMPKKAFTYRPVTYLLPLDSIIYQSLVDKIISYKKEKFSKQVYSNIINDVKSSEVFHNPVQHWLEMRENIRNRFKKGYKSYFFQIFLGILKMLKLIN